MARHPITAASFSIIDREIGCHPWSSQEYALVRRAIHATADFELVDLFQFSAGVISLGISALRAKTPVLVDVRMVAVAVQRSLNSLQIPLHCGLDQAPPTDPYGETGLTRTALGMETLARAYPQGICVVGNAPTALLRLVELIKTDQIQPALVVGVPVGFVGVEEAKAQLSALSVPQITLQGRKGGSPIAAALLNELVDLSQLELPENCLADP